jgi:hypothetical protein
MKTYFLFSSVEKNEEKLYSLPIKDEIKLM